MSVCWFYVSCLRSFWFFGLFSIKFCLYIIVMFIVLVFLDNFCLCFFVFFVVIKVKLVVELVISLIKVEIWLLKGGKIGVVFVFVLRCSLGKVLCWKFCLGFRFSWYFLCRLYSVIVVSILVFLCGCRRWLKFLVNFGFLYVVGKIEFIILDLNCMGNGCVFGFFVLLMYDLICFDNVFMFLIMELFSLVLIFCKLIFWVDCICGIF